MAEQIPRTENQPTAWRVVLLLGAAGMQGELDTSRLSLLPLEASFRGVISAGEQLRVEADEETTNHFIDWQLSGISGEEVVGRAVGATLQSLEGLSVNPDAVAIKGAWLTNDEGLFDRFPAIARADMENYTETAQDHTRLEP